MKKIKYSLEYIAVRIIDAFLLILPRAGALMLGEGMGVLASYMLSKRNRLAMGNLRRAFPEMQEEERRKVISRMWRNLGRTAAEFIRMRDIQVGNFSSFVGVEGRELIERARSQGRGIIFIAFHFTNWELTGTVTSKILEGVTAIARPMKNPYVEKWIRSKRALGGLNIILHRQAVKESLKLLRRKKNVAILVDQNLYTGGIFSTFFGRPAATTTLPALLASRTHSPLIIGYTLRTGSRYRLIFEEIGELPESGNMDEYVLDVTQRINNHLEKIIRRHPENWFWIHNRWKRQPEREMVLAS